MIYLIVDEDLQYCKVGYSKNPDKRLESLQIGSPHKLFIAATVHGELYDEAMIHKRWEHLAVRGEWFTFSEDMLNWLHDSKGYVNERSARKDTVKHLAVLKNREEQMSYLKSEILVPDGVEDIDNWDEFLDSLLLEVKSVNR